MKTANLPRSKILRGRTPIRSTLRARPFSSGVLSVHFLKGSERRAAFFAGKRLGRAVIRNRQKRLMRAAYRISQQGFPEGNIIFVLRRETNWDRLRRDFTRASKRLREI